MSVQPQLLNPRRRFITVALSLALLAGLGTSTQAGVIPWVYDAIFGPVRPMAPYAPAYSVPTYSYGSYPSPRIGATSYPTYSYSGYGGGFGCGPCYSPCQVQGPCATGGCANGACNVTGATTKQAPTTIAFYHPVYGWVAQNSACNTSEKGRDKVVPTPDKALANGDIGSEAPEANQTFTTPKPGEKDPFVSPMSVKKPVGPRNADAARVETDTADAATSGSDAKTTVVKKANDVDANKAESTDTDTAVKSDESTNKNGVVSTPALPNTDATTTTTTTTSSDSTDEKKDTDAADDSKAADAGFAEQPERGIDDKAFVEPKPGEKTEEQTGNKTLPLKAEDLSKPLDLDDKTSWVVPSIGVERIAFRPGFRNARLVRNSKAINVDFVIPTTSVTRIVSK